MMRNNRLRNIGGRSLAAIGIALVLGVLVVMVSIPASAVVVNFPDAALEAAIRDAIRKPFVDIHDTDLIGLTDLTANHQGIANLEGIQHCVDLTYLDLSYNQIVDTSALSGLTQLTELWLGSNQIADIRELSGLTNLTVLCLADNQIVDISALLGLTNLWELWLGNNQIGDIGPLSGLTNLTNLYLRNNEIVDIAPLYDLTNLTTLYLGNNQIVDISALSGLTNLKRLELYINEIVDIGPLSGLTNLTDLYLYANKIVDISALSGLTNLSWLDLRINEIVDIQALVNNSGLGTRGYGGDWVDLPYNYLDLTPGSPDMLNIEALERRGVDLIFDPQTLILPSVVIVNFPDAGLEAAIRDAIRKPAGDIHDTDLMGLTHLDASERGIVNLEGIQHCVHLTRLDLTYNRIVDISALQGLTKLTKLHLGYNDIVDIQTLVDNTGLNAGDFVYIHYNYLDLTPNSSDMLDIETLQGRGVNVGFDPQTLISPSAVVVNFPDAALEAVIRDAIRQPIRDIYDTDLMGLTSLRADHHGIANLEGIQHCVHLTRLELNYNRIVDISALSGLINLTDLWLDYNRIIDISGLSGLTNITKLILHHNQISDIAPLVNNPGIDSGDLVSLQKNQLLLKSGSPNMLDIETLQGRGVNVRFDPQSLIPSSAVVVTFSNPAIEAAIRNALWLPTGNIYDTDLIGLTYLDASERGIANLEGIQHCVNLTWLALNCNQIVDISALAGLGNLTDLSLGNNQIVDISPLSGLTMLTNLYLYANKIVDISALVNNAGLGAEDEVDISYNYLDLTPNSSDMLDIEALEGRGVNVDFDPPVVVVNFPDPEFEAAIRDAIEKPTGDIHDTDLIGLTHLRASRSIANVEGIQYCTNLTGLCLEENQIVDISLLAALTKLEWLSLRYSQIVDISALSGLTNLTDLCLWDNQIVDISALSGLTNLTRLNLGENGIVDISPLSGLTNLTWLDLPRNQIVDISPLSGLTNLTWLNLRNNQIVDISSLSGLTSLTELFLRENQIVDISALSGLTKLERLRLDNNQIVDISGLSGLTNITEIDLQSNQIRDIASLVNNAGIDSGDDVVLLYNLLTLTPGSPNMMDIDTLRRRGVNIFFTSGSVFIFPDPGLEAAIRDTIGKPTGDIHDTDLIGLTSLDANYRNIANLEGIQHCGDLTWLCLTHNQIVDISALSGLSNLKWLNLEDNQISDITPLVNNLGIHIGNSIALRGNPLLLVPGSQDMLSIETLQRRGVTVFFTAGVAVNFPDPGLEAAIRDTIGKPTGDIHDTDLIGLSFLFEVDRSIATLEGIQYCVDLTWLELPHNQIVDISPLSGLTKLTSLNLRNNQIVDISPLSGLINLMSLNLRSNQIVDISPLSGLTNLTSLTLNSNEIVDIHALSGLTNLEYLFLAGNEIVDISALSGLTNLTRLDLLSNQIVDIQVLHNTGLGSGDSVDIRYNSLDLAPGSPNILDIEALQGRGVDVDYHPQN